MSNLETLVKLEKLVQTVKDGKADLSLIVRGGEVVSVIATGKKKNLYNSSTKDVRTNTTALEDIVHRIKDQLDKGVSGEIVFRIKNEKNKIKFVEIESDQSFQINRPSSV